MQIQDTPRAKTSDTGRYSRSPLHVVCFSTYVAERSQQNERHLDVRSFLLALRGERVEGEAQVPVGGDQKVLTRRNANDSIDWFGEMVVRYLETNRIYPPFALVPVPTSNTTLESSAGPWTSLLAISIASSGLDDVSVVDILRWKAPLLPPNQRAQTVSELYDNLTLLDTPPRDVPIILVDYLFTSSSVLRAAAARLRRHGAQPRLALCAGRTATKAKHDPFTAVTGELHPYQPGH